MWETVFLFLKGHIELTLLGAVTLIQIAPIKINPWSWVADVGARHYKLLSSQGQEIIQM